MIDHTKWNQINDQAKALFDQKRFDEAVKLFDVNEDIPIELIPNLAKCLYHDKQADKSLKLLDSIKWYESHEIAIDYALYLNAVGDSDKAFFVLKSLENQNDPKVKFNSGWHHLREGNFIEGFQNLQHGKECRAWGNEYQYLEQGILDKSKRWDGISKGHFLFILEGGFGDQIIFLRWVRYLHEMWNCRVTVACSINLMRLFVNAGYNCIPNSEIKNCEYDYYIPAMSLPAIVADSWAPINNPKQWVDFPYIKTKEDRYISLQIAKQTPKHLRFKKIGIKWFGNPQFEHDQMRTVPKDELVRIASKHGYIFSFQFEDDENKNIPNMSYIVRDWLDTYSALHAMNLVVTSCTSIAHLCGAMGKKCIVLVPLVPYFTWASDKLPWYGDNITVIRQTKYNDWTEALEKLDRELSYIFQTSILRDVDFMNEVLGTKE